MNDLATLGKKIERRGRWRVREKEEKTSILLPLERERAWLNENFLLNCA